MGGPESISHFNTLNIVLDIMLTWCISHNKSGFNQIINNERWQLIILDLELYYCPKTIKNTSVCHSVLVGYISPPQCVELRDQGSPLVGSGWQVSWWKVLGPIRNASFRWSRNPCHSPLLWATGWDPGYLKTDQCELISVVNWLNTLI